MKTDYETTKERLWKELIYEKDSPRRLKKAVQDSLDHGLLSRELTKESVRKERKKNLEIMHQEKDVVMSVEQLQKRTSPTRRASLTGFGGGRAPHFPAGSSMGVFPVPEPRKSKESVDEGVEITRDLV